MKIKCFLTGFILTLFLVSCRKENSELVKQEDIWTDYRLIYKAELKTTFARASFKHNSSVGENLKLSSKSEILLNDNSIEFDGIYYWYEKVMDRYVKTVDFSYTDLDDKQFKNTISILDSAEIITSQDTLFKDSVQFIGWDGSALTANELVLLVAYDTTGAKLNVIEQDTLGTSGFYLVNSELNSLPIGLVDVHFERWNSFDINGTKAGGLGYSQYISKAKRLKLVEKD